MKIRMYQQMKKMAGCLVFVFCFIGICLAVDSTPLDEGEKSRLYSAWERSRSRATLPIDVTFAKKTIRSPGFTESKRKWRQQKTEEIRKIRKNSKKSNRNIKVKSAGFLSANKEEIHLCQKRVRINGFSKYRADVIYFGDEKKEKKNYDEARINNNETNFKIDKKRKRVSFSNSFRWGASRDALTYGTFVGHGEIVKDIIRFCRPNRVGIDPNVGKITREFRHKGIVKISGRETVVIEFFDVENKQSVYEMFLDVDDWGRCYRLVWYNKEGTCEKRITEFSKFLEDDESGILYPRLIVHKYFYEECEEKKMDIINIQKVSIGLSLPDDVFELNVNDDYTIIDRRMDPVLVIPAKSKSEAE